MLPSNLINRINGLGSIEVYMLFTKKKKRSEIRAGSD